eukprot:108355_1
MSNETLLFPWIILLTISISMGVWLLHSAWIYYQLMHMQIPSLRGRYSRVVIAIVILGASYFLIYHPWQIILFRFIQFNVSNVIPLRAYKVFLALLTVVTATIYPMIIVYRSWMVYFEIKWNMAIQDTKWSVFIDKNAHKNNWYLKHHETNKKYTSKIVAAIWFIFAIPSILCSFLGDEYSTFSLIFYGIQYFLPILMLTILLCKIPQYDDVFLIKNEIKMIIIASLITTVLYAPMLVLQAMIPFWGSVILFLYTLIGPFSILYPHLYFPFTKFNLPKTYYTLKRYSMTKDSLGTALPVRQNTDHDSFGLKECMQNEDGFLVFTRHMNKEFAVENILFLIEMYQFKRKLKVLYGAHHLLKSEDDILETMILPHNNMPKSTLITRLDKHNLHECVVHLFIKYVVDDAYFAINIAYEERIALYAAFGFEKSIHSNDDMDVVGILSGNIKDEMNENDAFHLFNAVIKQIYKLIRGSFLRFKQSVEFERLVKIHVDPATTSQQ